VSSPNGRSEWLTPWGVNTVGGSRTYSCDGGTVTIKTVDECTSAPNTQKPHCQVGLWEDCVNSLREMPANFPTLLPARLTPPANTRATRSCVRCRADQSWTDDERNEGCYCTTIVANFKRSRPSLALGVRKSSACDAPITGDHDVVYVSHPHRILDAINPGAGLLRAQMSLFSVGESRGTTTPLGLPERTRRGNWSHVAIKPC
jgi:hypothetical protein